MKRLLAGAAPALALVLCAVPALAQPPMTFDDHAYSADRDIFVPTMPTEALNPACPNAGGTGVAAPGVVGKTYGGTVCPAPANAPANFASSQFTLTATASQIVAGRPGRVTLTIYNTSAATEYVGPAGVTTATGFPIPSGQAVSLSFQGALYGVVSTGSASAAEYETF